MDDDAKNLLGEMPKGPVLFDKESKKASLLGDRKAEGKEAADGARGEARVEEESSVQRSTLPAEVDERDAKEDETQEAEQRESQPASSEVSSA
jgi:hypothetical protein